MFCLALYLTLDLALVYGIMLPQNNTSAINATLSNNNNNNNTKANGTILGNIMTAIHETLSNKNANETLSNINNNNTIANGTSLDNNNTTSLNETLSNNTNNNNTNNTNTKANGTIIGNIMTAIHETLSNKNANETPTNNTTSLNETLTNTNNTALNETLTNTNNTALNETLSNNNNDTNTKANGTIIGNIMTAIHETLTNNTSSPNETLTNNQCIMDVGLIIDELVSDDLLSSENILQKICDNIQPKIDGNRTSIAVIGNNSQVIVNFSDPSATDTLSMVSKMKEYRTNSSSLTKNDANETRNKEYRLTLANLVKQMFGPNETRPNVIKSLILMLANSTLERFLQQCYDCNEWILQNKINFYIVETKDGDKGQKVKPLKINWLSETNYYPLKSVDLVLTILPTIFSLSCSNNFSSNSAIFKSESYYQSNDTTKSKVRKHLISPPPFTVSALKSARKDSISRGNGKLNLLDCPLNIEKLGCLKSQVGPNVLQRLHGSDCGHRADKRTYRRKPNSICHCATKARSLKLNRFGINNDGHCFSYQSEDIASSTQHLFQDCHSSDDKKCSHKDMKCYHGRDSIVVYNIRNNQYSKQE